MCAATILKSWIIYSPVNSPDFVGSIPIFYLPTIAWQTQSPGFLPIFVQLGILIHISPNFYKI